MNVDVSEIPVLEWLSMRQHLPDSPLSGSDRLPERRDTRTGIQGTTSHPSDVGIGALGQRCKAATGVIRERKMTA